MLRWAADMVVGWKACTKKLSAVSFPSDQKPRSRERGFFVWCDAHLDTAARPRSRIDGSSVLGEIRIHSFVPISARPRRVEDPLVIKTCNRVVTAISFSCVTFFC